MEQLSFPAAVYWVFSGIALICAVTDFRSGKIYNWATGPTFVLGVVLTTVYSGWNLGLESLGIGLGVILILSPLFFLKVLGAGDIKLLGALATVLRFSQTREFVVVAFCLAGAGAAALLVRHGRVKIFIQEVLKSLRSLVLHRTFPGMVFQWPRLRQDIKAPFGVAIALAFAWVVRASFLAVAVVAK